MILQGLKSILILRRFYSISNRIKDHWSFIANALLKLWLRTHLDGLAQVQLFVVVVVVVLNGLKHVKVFLLIIDLVIIDFVRSSLLSK